MLSSHTPGCASTPRRPRTSACRATSSSSLIPQFLDRPNVLGIGEIGLNKNTRNEAIIFQEHLDLAASTNELILIQWWPRRCDSPPGATSVFQHLRQRVLEDLRGELHGADLS